MMVLRSNYPLPVKSDVVMGAHRAGEVVTLGAVKIPVLKSLAHSSHH
jgi:hypothetical protein